MDSRSLAAFLAVAETQSFSLAAQTLHLSQPAISKRIAQLEGLTGARLFDRVGRRVQLTEAGQALLPFARRIRQDLEDSARVLAHPTGPLAGVLSVATSHHVGLHRLPPVLKTFTQQHPGVELDLAFMDSEDACTAVQAGTLELAIVTLPTVPLAGLETRTVWHDPLEVVVAPEHPLARRRRVQLAEVMEYPAVLPDLRTYTHRILKAALQAQGLTPHVRLATNYLETLKMLVAIGLGWSVLPASMIDETIRCLAIPGWALGRELGAVWHAQRTRTRAARAMLDLLGEAASSGD